MVNEELKWMFCISTVKEERLLAGSLTTLLQSDCDSPLSPDCVSTRFTERTNIRRSQCVDGTNIAKKISHLISYIDKLQLAELISSGFCLKTSPQTARISIFKEHNPIVVCIGQNGPNADLKFFTPDWQRLKSDMESVGNIMGQVATADNIGLVTIARSNRDGYVPRKLQPAIEEGLLQILKDKLDTKLETIYDENLFVNS
mgnify:CR=1 FL=1